MVPDNHYNDLTVSVQENDNCVYHTLNTLRIAKDKALLAMRWDMRQDRLSTLWDARSPTTLSLSQKEYWNVTWKKYKSQVVKAHV